MQSTLDRLRVLYERQLRLDVQRQKEANDTTAAAAITSSTQTTQQLIAKEQQLAEMQRAMEETREQVTRMTAEREEERRMATAKEVGLVSVLEEKAENREEELVMMDGIFDCVMEEREREKAGRVKAEADLHQCQSMLYQQISQSKQTQAALKGMEVRLDTLKAEAASLQADSALHQAQAEQHQRAHADLSLLHEQTQTQCAQLVRDNERSRRAFEHNLALRDSRFCEMNQEVSELHARYTIVQLQLTRAMEAVECDSSRIEALQTAEAAAVHQIGVLEEILQVQNSVMAAKDATIQALQCRLFAESEGKAELSRQTQSMSGSLGWAAEQVSSLASSFSALEQRLQVKEAEIGEKEEEILILSSQLTLCQQDNATLAASLHRANADVLHTTTALTDTDAQCQVLQIQREADALRHSTLQRELEVERDTLRVEMDGLACQINAFTEERRFSMDARKSRGDRRRSADLLSTITGLERALQQKTAEFDTYRDITEARHEVELHQLQLSMLNKTTIIDGQTQEIQSLQDNVQQLSKALEDLRRPQSPPPSPSPSPFPFPSPSQSPYPSPSPSPRSSPSLYRQSMSFARVIGELKSKQAALATLQGTHDTSTALHAAMREKDEELDRVKENKRDAVMRMSLEIDRLKAELHQPEESPRPATPPPMALTPPTPDDEGAVALERLVNNARMPFRPTHPFPSLAVVQSRAQSLFPPSPNTAPVIYGTPLGGTRVTHVRMTPQEVIGLSPMRSIEVRMKRKRLSVDFEGMDSEEEISQSGNRGVGAVIPPPLAVSKCSIM